jgi:hypothetical protein
MRKIKFQVNRNEAVRLIRSGAGDPKLMETLHLSAAGLEKLFRKLVEAGEIEQSELDRRRLVSERSHVVNLTDEPVKAGRDALVNTHSAVRDIRAGMTDVDLMEKYNLSAAGLQSLMHRLLDAEKVTRKDLDRRQAADEWNGPDVSLSKYGDDQPTEMESLPRETSRGSRLRLFVHAHRVQVAAICGALAGMVMMAGLISWLGYGPRIGVKGVGQAVLSRGAENEPLAKQVDEAVAILESVARDRAAGNTQAAQIEADVLQQCLESCKNTYAGVGDTEKSHLLACRRECLQNHSELFRKIRQRYHGSLE